MKTVVKDIFLKQMLNIQKKLFNLYEDLPFLPERKKIENSKILFVVQNIKKNMLFTKEI